MAQGRVARIASGDRPPPSSCASHAGARAFCKLSRSPIEGRRSAAGWVWRAPHGCVCRGGAVGAEAEEAWRRAHLGALIQRFRRGAAHLGLPLMTSDSAIQPLLIGKAEKAIEISERLQTAGFLVAAIRPPTVPVGTSRLRITLSASHSEAQVDQLLDTLARTEHRAAQ